MTRRRLTAVWIALLALAPVAARAQFQQYTRPGQFEEQRESMQERLDRAMHNARWRLGRLYLDPWVGIRNISYISDVRGATAEGESKSDLTATAGAGLHLYRPIGAQTTFAAYALPEYVWWRRLTERRRTNGRYGAGLFVNLGRTGFRVTGTRDTSSRFFSREFEVPVNTRDDEGATELEVRLVGGLAVFAGGELRRFRYLDTEGILNDTRFVDRDERILRGGFRFHAGPGIMVGVGAEHSQADFRSSVRDRSNSGTSPILQIELEGSGFYLTSNLAYRDLKPDGSSAFVPYRAVTGDAQFEGRVGHRFRPQLFASRNLVYALDSHWAYFEDTLYGLGLRLSLGSASSVRVFGQAGTNDYTALASGVVDRRDDIRAWGGDLRFGLGRFSLILGATRTRYDSSLSQYDREITVIRSGLVLGVGGGSPWG